MRRIVVMEDSRTQAERLRQLLIHDGWSVQTCVDGQKGVDACIADPPDIVVSDILMPGLDGYEVCRTLGAHERTKDVPVVLLTSLADPLDVVRALAAGAANFVTKPYRDEQLLTRLQRTLVTAERGAQPISIRGEEVRVQATSERILDVLVSALEDAKARNEELASSHAALAISEATNRQLYQQATEANRAKDEFLAVASHELRTPLNAIVGWAALLREGGPRVDMKKAIETIERNAKAQARLIDDVLDVSRITTGKLNIERLPLDFPTIVANAVDSVRVQAASKGLSIEATIEREDIAIVGDPDRLNQVVLNLLSNAVKFTHAGGKIDVSLSRCHPEKSASTERRIATLSIRDTGKGIAPNFLPYVFDQFRQADTSSSRQHSGLGLGLAIVKHLIELHGGTIRAESDGVGKGAQFVVELPCDGDKPTVAKERESARALGEATLAGLRILVVDDETDARDVLAIALAAREAEVRTAGSAQMGYDLMKTFEPNVLISDIGMPGENGLTFIARARATFGQKFGAIALTAYTDPQSARAATGAGFDAHLPKPVVPASIIAAIVRLRAEGRTS